MKIKMIRAILIIFIVAVCTFITRVFPFVLFGRTKRIPKIIQYLGAILPSAIMITLIIYCLKDSLLILSSTLFANLISIGVVVLLHIWKKNTLLSIGAGTFLYMLFVQFILV